MAAPDWFCPLPLDCSETYGRLSIDEETLHRGAWCAFNLSPLYDSSEFRGDNVLVERLEGRVARPIVTDETDYTLRLMFSGAVKPDGTPWAAPAGGILANRRAFHDTYLDPIRSGTASLPATLEVPDPDDPNEVLVYEFDVQPLRLTGWTLLPNAYARANLDIRVPVPELVEAGGES